MIAAGVSISGNLAVDGDIVIDGHLKGDLKSAGNVVVGINAHIQGHITAINATISGQVFGNVTIAGETILEESARLEGNVKTNTLSVASGAGFVGGCETKLSDSSEQQDFSLVHKA